MAWRQGLEIDQKRRKLGLFIGLRGCESPTIAEDVQDILRERSEAEIWSEAENVRDRELGRKMGF